MYKIFISPSDQTKNTYVIGNTNEAVQCGRIAEKCKEALERCGFKTMVVQYETMASKCAKSDAFGADLHLPIHTNAFNGVVAGTRIMSYDLKGDGYKASKSIFDRLAPITPGKSENVSAQPQLYEIKTPKAPTAYIEVDFHDNKEAAQWIIDHPTEIAEAICMGICDYFNVTYITKSTDIPANTTSSVEKFYKTLGEVTDKYYRPTLDKLVMKNILRGQGGTGDNMIINLYENDIRILVMLDRAGCFD